LQTLFYYPQEDQNMKKQIIVLAVMGMAALTCAGCGSDAASALSSATGSETCLTVPGSSTAKCPSGIESCANSSTGSGYYKANGQTFSFTSSPTTAAQNAINACK
jgi:hypothetical protein